MNRAAVEKALMERLGITPEQVRACFENMEPINIGVFTQEVRKYDGTHPDG